MKKIYCIITLLALVGLVSVCSSCSESEDELKYPEPTITSFSPSEGLPTSVVTITGTNFGNTRTERVGRVYFGGVEATDYVSYSDNEIKVRVPDNAESGPIAVWVWKNHVESDGDFTFIPGAEIKSITPTVAFPGSEITMEGINFKNFLDMPLLDIVVSFQGAEGNVTANPTSLTENELKVVVPLKAKSGAITVAFGDSQIVAGPELTLVGDYTFTLTDYLKKSGTISIDEYGVGSTKKGAYVIYQFTAPATGLFDAVTQTATTKSGSYLNVNIGDDLNTLKTAALNSKVTQTMPNTGSWTKDEQLTFGSFYLEEGKTYYLKVTFLQDGSTWVGNLHGLKITLSDDQSATPINGSGAGKNYVIYKSNFNAGTYSPFVDGWAWSPSYIKIVDNYLEFYFNQAALDTDNRRERKGCEVTCDYKTTSEGWYGFKIFLPSGKFPKNIDGSVIAQIFNNGDANTWAGHVKINKDKLVVSYRGSSSASAASDHEVGTLSWDTWIPVIVYFKAGRNGKGNIKVWMGNSLSEGKPTYDSGNINLGFGDWLDDNTLNGEVTSSNSVADYLGCKFGLYVSTGGDRTIRFDNLNALEGNPDGAFDLVNPHE